MVWTTKIEPEQRLAQRFQQYLTLFLGDECCIREYSDKAVVQSKDILAMYLSFYPYIEPRRECAKLVVENERHESFATIDRMFFFLLQLTKVAEV